MPSFLYLLCVLPLLSLESSLSDIHWHVPSHMEMISIYIYISIDIDIDIISIQIKIINLKSTYKWKWSGIYFVYVWKLFRTVTRNQSVPYQTSCFVNRFTPKYTNICITSFQAKKFCLHGCEVSVKIYENQLQPTSWLSPPVKPFQLVGYAHIVLQRRFRNGKWITCAKTGVLYVNDAASSLALLFSAFRILNCCNHFKKSPIRCYTT